MSKQAEDVFAAMAERRRLSSDHCFKCKTTPAYKYEGDSYIILGNSYCSSKCLLATLEGLYGRGTYYINGKGLVDNRYS